MADHDGRAELDRLTRVSGAGERGDGTCAHALRDERRRRGAERRHEPLRGDQHGGAVAHARADLTDRGRQARAGHREHDEVDARELDLGDGPDVDASVELEPGQVARVLAGGAERLGLRAGAAAELDVQSRAREHDGRGRAHRARAHDGRRPERREAAEPLPLKLDAGPDPLGDLARQEPRRLLHAREGERRPEAEVDLHRLDAPAVAGVLGVRDGDRDDGLAALEGQAADAALRLRQRARADARALGEDHDGLAALQQRERRGHRLLVRGAALDREGAEAVQEPAEDRVLEQLALGDEVDRPPDAAADRERVEEAAVIRGEDDAAVRHVLGAEPAEAEVDEDRRLHHPPDRPVHERIDAAASRALVVALQGA